MSVIYMYTIPRVEHSELTLPAGAEFLSVQMQDSTLCAWFCVEPENPQVKWKFQIAGTGAESPSNDYSYLATAQDDIYVWHVFAKPPAVEVKSCEGVYEKFDVVRTDGKSAPGEKHHNCEYFVLDVTHDEFAAAALKAYAEACKEKLPKLAEDMVQRYKL